MVVSDLGPYDEYVEHGVTAFRAGTAEEFTEYTMQLCQDAALRKQMGAAARQVVMERHTMDACADQWRAALA